jgi:hypothetical protein
MSTRTEVAAPWHWVTPAPRVSRDGHERKAGVQELWAGAIYLMVWSLLWLAVIVTVLSPLEALFGGAQ